MKYKKQVEQLKSSFTVEGVPIINSNKFTDEEIANIRKENSAHSSHWNHFGKGKRQWTDEEIHEQIETFMSLKVMSEDIFWNLINGVFKKLPYKDRNHEKDDFIKILNVILNIDGKKEFNQEFWLNFGSAPYFIENDSRNEKLKKYRKQYGACGMNEIFGEHQFDEGYHLIRNKYSAIQKFDTTWDAQEKYKEMDNYKSNFNSLDEIEENVVVKKVYEEAKKFYHDKSKDFEERVKVFNEHGDSDGWIHHPENSDLNHIFEIYYENDYIRRGETVYCIDVIEWWIDALRNNRTKLDWKNPYHPKRVHTKRNYKPSKDAVNRLKKYYLEKLMLEEISSFTFDW